MLVAHKGSKQSCCSRTQRLPLRNPGITFSLDVSSPSSEGPRCYQDMAQLINSVPRPGGKAGDKQQEKAAGERSDSIVIEPRGASQRNEQLTPMRAASMLPVVSSSSRQSSKKVMLIVLLRTARMPMPLKENSTSFLSRMAPTKNSRVSWMHRSTISERKWMAVAISSKSS